MPAGTYRLTGELRLTKGIGIRGDGPDKTRLVNEATTKHIISIINWDQDPVAAKITQGYAKGSASIVVSDASKYQPGDLLLVDQLNDPELVDNKGGGGVCGWASRDKGTRAMGQLVQLAAKNGNALALRRPLSFTFKEALAPEVVRTVKAPIAGAGVEDLYLEMTSRRTDNSSAIKMMNSMYCWVKNIESFKTWYGGHVTLQSCLGCEVRDSHFHHTHAFGAGHGYGIFVFHHTTDTLVENNLFYYLNAPMLCECSGPGNVFGYNFSWRTFGRDYPDTDWAHNDMAMHGAHCYMNLFEGNFGATTGFDFYWGSASHTTLLRNFLDMDCRTVSGRPMMAVIGVRIDTKNYFMNVVGNVLGTPGTQGIVETPAISGFNQKLVWRLGYRTPSGSGPPDDPKVAETALRHGNFNFISQQTQWDPKIPGRQLPKSLYLTAKPAFFGKLPWPAVGPDLKPLVGTIPARERFLKIPARRARRRTNSSWASFSWRPARRTRRSWPSRRSSTSTPTRPPPRRRRSASEK